MTNRKCTVILLFCTGIFPRLSFGQPDLSPPPLRVDSFYFNYLDSMVTEWYGRYQFDSAFQYAQKELEVCPGIFGAGHERCGWALNNYGMICQNLGLNKEAETSFRQVITMHVYPQLTEYGLNNLAGLLQETNRVAEAISLYERLLQRTRERLGENNPEYLEYCTNLGLAYDIAGQYTKAENLYQEVHATFKMSGDTLSNTYGALLNQLGMLYVRLGRAPEALPLLLDAAGVTMHVEGVSSFAYGVRLGNLADVYLALGLLDKALDYGERSLNIARATAPKNSNGLALAIQNLALIYLQSSDLPRADTLLKEAYTIFDSQTLSTGGTAGVLHNLASVYFRQGNTGLALDHQQKALAVMAHHRGVDDVDYGKILLNLIRYQFESGAYAAAIDSCYRALDIFRTQIGENSAYYGDVLHHLSRLLERIGEPESALNVAQKAAKNVGFRIDHTFSVLNENEKSDFLQLVEGEYYDQLSFAWRHAGDNPEWAALCFNNALRHKNLLLNSTRQLFSEIRKSENPKLDSLLRRWSETRQLLAVHYGRPRADRPFDMDSLQREIALLETNLTLASRHFASHRRQVDWKEVVAALQPGEAVVEFVRFPYSSGQTAADSVLYAALVLTQALGSPRLVRLFEEKQLEKQLSPEAESTRDYLGKVYCPGLYQLIWSPLDSFLAGIKTVYYVPSGLLYRISVPALSAGGGKFLADCYALYYLSSSRNLVLPPATTASSWTSAWVYGGINYEMPDSLPPNQDTTIFPDELTRNTERGYSWAPLPNTLVEARKLNVLLGKQGIRVRLFSGDTAREETVKTLADVPAPDILHFGTHGFFFPDVSPEAPDQPTGSDGGRRNFMLSGNPLFRSGLVLAGGNYAWREGKSLPGREDGILTAYEIAHLDLSGARLVVLSACKSGLGDIRGSEGVYGLQRAFKQAGAGYLLVSLWNVPDTGETIRFIETFFRACMNKGLPPREAFQRTQRLMRKRTGDPYYWAGFVLID